MLRAVPGQLSTADEYRCTGGYTSLYGMMLVMPRENQDVLVVLTRMVASGSPAMLVQ